MVTFKTRGDVANLIDKVNQVGNREDLGVFDESEPILKKSEALLGCSKIGFLGLMTVGHLDKAEGEIGDFGASFFI